MGTAGATMMSTTSREQIVMAKVLGFVPTRRGAGPQENGALGKDQRRVLDEHGVRKRLQRRQGLHREPRRLQRRDVGAVLGGDAGVGGSGVVPGAQTIDDASGRGSDNSGVESDHGSTLKMANGGK